VSLHLGALLLIVQALLVLLLLLGDLLGLRVVVVVVGPCLCDLRGCKDWLSVSHEHCCMFVVGNNLAAAAVLSGLDMFCSVLAGFSGNDEILCGTSSGHASFCGEDVPSEKARWISRAQCTDR
jgi:hypothetical protein